MMDLEHFSNTSEFVPPGQTFVMDVFLDDRYLATEI